MFRHAIRVLVWFLLRTLYRIRIRGRLPLGPAILTPNHVSYIDAVLIAAHIERPIAFAMYWKLFRRFRWIVEPMGAFPIASREENPAIYAEAFEIISRTLVMGGLVCLFPEGRITTDGELGPFRNGILKIIARDPVPVIPVGLQNLWGSYFSKKKAGLFKLPDHFMARITMVLGDPIAPDDVTIADLHNHVSILVDQKNQIA